MKDYVKIEHYKAFLELNILWHWKDELEKEYLSERKRKEHYESGFFARLFNWKYEDSQLHFDVKGEDTWNVRVIKGAIKNVEAEIARLEYHQKTTNLEMLHMELDVANEFYLWCQENKIPY